MQDIIIYNTSDGKVKVSLFAKDGMVWMNQSQLAELFDTSKQNIGQHISIILRDNELVEDSVVKNYFTTASDGKAYNVTFYSLEMILSIGFRVRSKRGTQFRIWANQNLKEYMTKGFVMDDNRLKNPDGRPDYFDELLERIREIRVSEKRFYQKVRELLSLSSDYDANDKSIQMFFAETQNKLLYAVTGKTAAELIIERASSEKENMGLTAWDGEIVRKHDIIIAKNYLSNDEIDTLNRLVIIFLETAELTVKERNDLNLKFWKDNIDRLLQFQNKKILIGKGFKTHTEMGLFILNEYNKFEDKRKKNEAIQEDIFDLEQLQLLTKYSKEK